LHHYQHFLALGGNPYCPTVLPEFIFTENPDILGLGAKGAKLCGVLEEVLRYYWSWVVCQVLTGGVSAFPCLVGTYPEISELTVSGDQVISVTPFIGVIPRGVTHIKGGESLKMQTKYLNSIVNYTGSGRHTWNVTFSPLGCLSEVIVPGWLEPTGAMVKVYFGCNPNAFQMFAASLARYRYELVATMSTDCLDFSEFGHDVDGGKASDVLSVLVDFLREHCTLGTPTFFFSMLKRRVASGPMPTVISSIYSQEMCATCELVELNKLHVYGVVFVSKAAAHDFHHVAPICFCGKIPDCAPRNLDAILANCTACKCASN